MPLTNNNSPFDEVTRPGDTTVRGKFDRAITLDEFMETEYFYNRAVEYPNAYKEVVDPDDENRILHIPEEGRVIIEGTPLSAENLNPIVWACLSLLYFRDDMKDEFTKLRTMIATQLGLSSSDSFVMSVADGDFEIIDGWYNQTEQRVEVI